MSPRQVQLKAATSPMQPSNASGRRTSSDLPHRSIHHPPYDPIISAKTAGSIGRVRSWECLRRWCRGCETIGGLPDLLQDLSIFLVGDVVLDPDVFAQLCEVTGAPQ